MTGSSANRRSEAESPQTTYPVRGVLSSMVWILVLGLGTLHGHAGDQGPCIGIVDGDTLLVEIEGASQAVHLWGIDAPELDQQWGAEAREFIVGLVEGKPVTVEWRPGRSNRDSGMVTFFGEDLALAVVSAGFAWLPKSGDSSESYAAGLFVARAQKAGMWAEDHSLLKHPEDWVEQHRVKPTPTPTPTPIPTTLSGLARHTPLDETEIAASDGEGIVISNDRLRAMPLSLPDSPYSRCIRPPLDEAKSIVPKLRHFAEIKTRPLSKKQLKRVGELKSQLCSASSKLYSCRASSVEYRGHSKLRNAVRAYCEAARETAKNPNNALLLMSEGDELLNAARLQFNESYAEKQRRTVESNHNDSRYD